VCVTATIVVQVKEQEAMDVRRNGRTPQRVVHSRWDSVAAVGMRLGDSSEKWEGAAGRAATTSRRAVQGPATATMRVVVVEM